MPACLQIPQCPHKSCISNLTSASSQSLNTAMSSDSQNFIPHRQFIRIQLNILHTVTNPAATALRFSVRSVSQRWRTFQCFVCSLLFSWPGGLNVPYWTYKMLRSLKKKREKSKNSRCKVKLPGLSSTLWYLCWGCRSHEPSGKTLTFWICCHVFQWSPELTSSKGTVRHLRRNAPQFTCWDYLSKVVVSVKLQAPGRLA